MAGRRRGFGYIRKLPSKRYQASYIGPDQERHNAPVTYSTIGDAEQWLNTERKRIEADAWQSPADRKAAATAERNRGALTLDRFITDVWLPDLDIRPLTRRDYESLIKNHIRPALGSIPVRDLSKADVRTWWAGMDPAKPRARSKAFQLLHNIMTGAVDLELIDTNPVALPSKTKVRTKRAKKVVPLTLEQLNALADAIRPERLRMAVLLGCWCALRYGELTELRRSDVDLDNGVLNVSRGVVKVRGGYQAGPPKTEAGDRTVHIPPFLVDDLKAHLRQHAAWGKDGLLFPASNGGYLNSSTFARAFQRAAEAAKRPDVTPHTLRHTGASLATSAGATTADVMARLGHTTPAMAMVYQHSLDGADKRVAGKLSQLGKKAK